MVKTRFSSIFWRILKFISIAIAGILLLFSIVTWIVVEKKNDWLLKQIQTYLDESQSGQLEIGTVDLRLFRSFPDITLALDTINYYEHRDSLRALGEKPILHASQLFIAIEFWPLINEELKISEISISNAQLHIMEYQNGVHNINRALGSPVKSKPAAKKIVTKPRLTVPPAKKKETRQAPPAKPKSAVQIDLQSLNLSNMIVTYIPYNNPDSSVISIQQLEVNLSKDETKIAVNLNIACAIQSLHVNRFTFPSGDLTLTTELQYEKESQQISMQSGEVNYNAFSATLQGSYAHQKNQSLNLQIDASANDLQLLSVILTPEVLQQNPGLLKSGDIYINGKIFGELKNQPPQVDLLFGVKDLVLRLPNKLGTFKNIGFDGSFKSGSLADYSRAALEIKDVRGQFPGGFIKGQFQLSNFAEPYLKYNLDAQLKLDGYDRIFKINVLKNLSGYVSLHADFDGPVKIFGTHQADSSRSSWIAFNNLSFVLAKNNQSISGLSGKMENRNNLTSLQHLTIHYGKNDLLINAQVENLAHLLVNNEYEIIASGNLRSNQFFTKDFIADTLSTAAVQDRISNLSFDFTIKTSSTGDNPKSGIASLAFDIKNLSAKLDELPDIKKLETKGIFHKTGNGLALDLNAFHATLPHGKLDVTGDLLIPQKRLWQFNARVKATPFPWTYVKELAAEIKSGTEPSAKNLPVKEMDILTADLDLTASITTYPFDINKLDVRNSRVNFSFPDSKIFSVEKLNLTLENLYFNHPENSGSLTGLKSTKGKLEFRQLKMPGLNKFDIRMNVAGANDILDIAFSSETQKAKNESGHIRMDISKKEIGYQLHYLVQDASLEYFIKKYYKKKFMEGNIDYTLNLNAKGSSWVQVKQNLSGTIEITGDSLTLYGVNIDDALKKYKQSQNFNLTDLGAVLIAGPVGLAVTKGSDFVSLATINLDSTHKTKIVSLLTKWKLENQQLITEDVAFATGMNRIAFNGSINFANDSIPGLMIAVVDVNGCSLMDQKLYGKTTALKTGKLNITKTLLGSVINFVNAVVGKDCKPVYTGKVKDPLH